MKNSVKLTKRIMAMVLMLCMMQSSKAGYVPGWFAAFAEESAAEETSERHEKAPSGRETSKRNKKTRKQKEKSAEKREKKQKTRKQKEKSAEKQ